MKIDKKIDFDLPREDHLDQYIKMSAKSILEWLQQAKQFMLKIKESKKED